MGIQDSTPRRLGYPLNLSVSPLLNGGDMGDPAEAIINWASPDPDEKLIVSLQLSLNEYVAIASAIDAGRDIAYSDQAIELWDIWVKGFLSSMDICQLIANCLSDPDSPAYAVLQGAIGEFIQDNTDTPVLGQEVPATPNYYDQDPPLIDLSASCDIDQLFGAITAIITEFNVAVTDLLQIIEGNSNTAELAEKVAKKIPFLGEYVGSIPEWVDWMIEVFAENYNGAYTTAVFNKMRCDLFCMSKESCTLSFQQFADYFAGLVGSSITGDMFSILDDIMSTAWVGENIVYAMHYLVCTAVSYSQNFMGIDGAFLSRIIQIAYGYPDDDWSILCTECAWCHLDTTFTDASKWNSDGGADNQSGWGTVTNRRLDNINGVNSKGAQVEFLYNFATPINLTRVTVNYTIENFTEDQFVGRKDNDTGAWVAQQFPLQAIGTYSVDLFTTLQVVSSIRIAVSNGYGGATSNRTTVVRINSVKFYGSGDIPFAWDGVC